MTLLASKSSLERSDAEATLERSAHAALVVSLAILAVAGVFFLMLYLIAR